MSDRLSRAKARSWFNAVKACRNPSRWTVDAVRCDICGHRCVEIVPVARAHHGNQCPSCSSMALYSEG